MTKAGHADIGTTRIHLHPAQVVFPDEATRLETRLLGAADRENLVPQFVPTQAAPS